MKDYYSILGLPREATAELIKATYLALSKIYHPDVFKGNKTFAQKRMQEINEAYETLSNTKKRSEYDKKIYNHSDESSFDYSEFQDEQTSYQKIIKDTWDFAKEYYPFIDDRYKELKKINTNLAWQFQILVIETKSFESANEISNRLKNEWLKKYFGKNEEIQNIAMIAIEKKQIKIAKEINKAIKILGDVDPYKIKSVLQKKFPKFKFTDNASGNNTDFTDTSNSVETGYYKRYKYIKFNWDYYKIIEVPPYHKIDAINMVFSSKQNLIKYIDDIA